MSELSNIFQGENHGSWVDISPDKNAVSFTLQEGPIKEVGGNGCQIDALIGFARGFIAYHNKKYPCRENSCAITKLDEAMQWLRTRTERRTEEGIEGTNQEKVAS